MSSKSFKYRFLEAIFPELRRLETDSQRRVAFTDAKSRLESLPLYVSIGIGVVLLFGAVIFSLPWLGVPMELRGRIRLAGLIVVFLCPWWLLFVLRRRMRRLLRESLVKVRIPICIHCGYDLTGNTTGVCPECGTQIASPSPDSEL